MMVAGVPCRLFEKLWIPGMEQDLVLRMFDKTVTKSLGSFWPKMHREPRRNRLIETPRRLVLVTYIPTLLPGINR
jgi:hypothetical protein